MTAAGGTRPTAYDVAGRYDAAYYGDLARRYLRRTRFARQRLANVLSLLPEVDGRRVLDLGCGMGTFTIESARRGAFALGVDLSAEALPAARRVAAAAGVAAGDHPRGSAGPAAARGRPAGGPAGGAVAFLRADAARLPIADAAVDVVLAADFTEHLDDATLARVLAEARRVLRPRGTLVLYTPSPTHLLERLRDAGILRDRDPSHIGMRTAEELAAAVHDAGFSVRRVAFLPSHLPVLRPFERLLAGRVPLLRRRIGLVAERAAGTG